MKDKTIKNIRICCYVALAFCVLWIVVMVNYLIADILGYGPWPKAVDWSQNTAMKIAVLACCLVGSVAMIALSIKVVINILKGIRENVAFPKSNVKLLFWMAFVDFVYMLGFTNLPNLWSDDVIFTLLHTNFITPFFLLFFAFMYKVAADAVEENNLTI